MADVLKLVVTTPVGLALEAEAHSVRAQSVKGELGILPGHLPLLAALRCGLVWWRMRFDTRVACMGPGFLEVEPDRVNVLSDLFALPDEIDVDETKKELAAANEALMAFGERHEGPAYEELQRDIDWAQAKLDCVAAAEKLV